MKKASKASKASKVRGPFRVSIVTPTSLHRLDCLRLIAKCILAQKNVEWIKEWIIVSGDKTWNRDDFKKDMKNIQSDLPGINLIYEYVDESTYEKYGKVDDYEAIGYLRNVTNMLVRDGDYIVCMDDDDYYGPNRVTHAVTKLSESDMLVAGCSGHMMYDLDLKHVFQFRKMMRYHTINSVMAYKRKYIDDGNRYDDKLKFAEEPTFLKNFTTPLIQLDPKHCVLQMAHSRNTYKKRQMILDSELVNTEQKNIHFVSRISKGYIPANILSEYEKALYPNIGEDSGFDIVYYLGKSPLWSPLQNNLGGSEQAVKHLSEEWARWGLKVAVYGNFENPQKTHGVEYFHYLNFQCSLIYKTLILWRGFGLFPIIKYCSAKRIILDSHDKTGGSREYINFLSNFEGIDKINFIMAKSKFHGYLLSQEYKENNNIKVIPNGVRVDYFGTPPDPVPERDPYRLCWCSCYTRGLEPILKYLIPTIRKLDPRFTFHIYYGMDLVKDMNFKHRMTELLKQDGVFEYGKQNIDVIRKEKYTSSFHLYYSKTSVETDCISIRESICAGCVPIISKFNVFVERKGIHLDGDPNNEEDMKRVALSIVELVDNEELHVLRKKHMGNETTWKEIALAWSDYLDCNNIGNNIGNNADISTDNNTTVIEDN